MADFVMPTLGADMEAGTLSAWLKQPGDQIVRGEVIAEVDTDKGLIEVECFTTGVVERLLIEPGQKVPVGTKMAVIRETGATSTAIQSDAPPVAAPAVDEAAHLHVSPLARKAAGELGVDLSKICGTGPGGRITKADVVKALGNTGLAAPRHDDTKNRMRQAIAAAMAKSKREIPHYYLGTSIDLTNAMTWLTSQNLNRPVTERLLPGVLLIKAVALALREYPEFNAVWRDGESILQNDIHVGISISLRQGGLVAPAIAATDRQTLDQLMTSLQDLVKRARGEKLRSSELADSTITITNLGDQGVEEVFGIIYPPQVALVGFGRVTARPWVVEGRVETRQVIRATLSADHRASDGHRGGLFLMAIDRLLQKPEEL